MVDESHPEPPAHETYRTAQSLSAGQLVLGRYTLKKFLGRGGFGVVWLAQDEEIDLGVAIKFLSDLIVNNPEAVADLKRETRHSLRLTHPHIVRIHGFIQGPQIAGISMEYVDGGTLSALKAARPQRCFDAPDLVGVVTELIDALDYAHTRAQIVHRDLKPGNLMLTAANELKVADFGISRSISDTHTRLTDAGATSGTPAYMSPQQMMGQPPRITDDIYSLGATIYDLLAGKPPFYTGDVPSQVLRVTPPPIAQRREEMEIEGAQPVPPEWEAALAACLAKSPENRPPNVREVAALLGLAVPSRSLTESRPPGPNSGEISRGGGAGESTPSRGSAPGATAHTPTPAATGAAISVARPPEPSSQPSANWTPTGPTAPPRTNLVPLLVVGGVAVAVVAGLLFFLPRKPAEKPVGAQVPAGAASTASPLPPGGGPPEGGAAGSGTATEAPAPTMAGGAPSTPPPPVDTGRAERVAALQRSIPAALAARRWDEARRDIDELIGLDPAAPGLARWQGQLATGLAGDDAGQLRESVARAVNARRWDDAQRDLDALRALLPGDPQATQWQVAITEGRRLDAANAVAPTLPPAAPAEAAAKPEPPPAAANDEELIRGLVDAYARSLAALDINQYAALWRSLPPDNREKIGQSFANIRSQTVEVAIQGLDMTGEAVTVRGKERRRVEMKQGSPQSVDLSVRFTLEKGPGGRWQIVRLEYNK